MNVTGTSLGYFSANLPGGSVQSAQNPVRRAPVFDQFQRHLTQPEVPVLLREKLGFLAFHPVQAWTLYRQGKAGAGEPFFQRMKMYRQLANALDRNGKKQLNALLKQGVLSDQETDDQHSALYHLYSLYKTPRARGFGNKTLLAETVNLLHKPYLITQKFAPLSETTAQQLLQTRNYPSTLERSGLAPLPGSGQPARWEDLNVENSATCVASSVMYYMLEKKPGELVRHLNELTSPLEAFYEKAKLSEIAPDNPTQAYQILTEQHIPYYASGPDEVMIRVNLPKTGKVRATHASQQKNKDGQFRSGIEAAYQSAITYLATKSYDPATDMRDSDQPGVGSKGLTESEKTLMETIIKDNGGVQSVTYQHVSGKSNPTPEEAGRSYLFGYTRSHDKTVTDLVTALKAKEFVIVGITDTDTDGSIVGGHEITLTGYFVDPKDGELKFVVMDSDDNVPAPVVRTARELIPKIHHAGLPLRQARQINREISALQGYMVPDTTDANYFQPIARAAGSPPTPQVEQAAPSPQPTMPPSTRQVVDWVPVWTPYPASGPIHYSKPWPVAMPLTTSPATPMTASWALPQNARAYY